MFFFPVGKFKIQSIINAIDYFILIVVVFTLLGDLIDLIYYIINSLIHYFNLNVSDLITYMVEDKTKSVAAEVSTSTTIIHDDGSWGNGVRSLFIYGTGALRLSLLRNGGTPASRAFVVVTTLAGDVVLRAVNNTINDPSYVKNHYVNWKFMWKDITKGEVNVVVDSDTLNTLSNTSINADTSNTLSNTSINKLIGDGDNLNDLAQGLLNGIFDSLKFILEPVQVTYSNDLLANQINDLSILLFVLAIIIFSLIIVLLFNLFMYINMDKIIQFFNNKYIKWYLTLNKKFISIEICFLGCSILYFMYTLITGIRFIATHPIIIN